MASAAAAGVGTADLRAWKWVMGHAGGRGRRARPAPRPPPHPQLRRHRNRRGIGDKNLLRPQPRLRTGFFSVLECSMIPAGYIPEACTSVGAAKYGRPLGLDERIKVDLIVIGLVAVDPNSGAWLGKGEILHCLAKIYLDPSGVTSLVRGPCCFSTSCKWTTRVIQFGLYSQLTASPTTNKPNAFRAPTANPDLRTYFPWRSGIGGRWIGIPSGRRGSCWALKMFRDEVLSRVNAMASALLPLPWKEKQQHFSELNREQ
ncbi:hypothetical protein EJB05_28232, partial [Eragrostis curvula]